MTKHLDYKNLEVIVHPLIQHKLTIMRDINTSKNKFRQLLGEITILMGYEITRDFKLTTRKIKTPVAPMDAPVLSGRKAVIVPVLRAGLTMSDGLEQLMPSARVGHIGLYRDPETKKPVEYLVKLPDMDKRICLLVDPMLATGNSLIHAIKVLIEHGVVVEDIRVVVLVSAPEGIRNVEAVYPDVKIFTASLDDHLNDHAYIVPGLGDAGDRMFGTK